LWRTVSCDGGGAGDFGDIGGVSGGLPHGEVCGRGIFGLLGIRMILSRNEAMPEKTDAPRGGAFRQGIFTEALNPKTALFFLSFIPQFIAPERDMCSGNL